MHCTQYIDNFLLRCSFEGLAAKRERLSVAEWAFTEGHISVISLHDILEDTRETLVLFNSERTEVLKTDLPNILVSEKCEENG